MYTRVSLLSTLRSVLSALTIFTIIAVAAPSVAKAFELPNYSPEVVKAPDFTVLDANENKVNLPAPGKPVVLNFWASWCPPCRSEMADFEALYKEMGNDVTFMMINLAEGQRETIAKAKKFVENNKFTFPIFFDTDFSAAGTYGVSALPTTIFIDRDGNVAGGIEGVISASALRSELTKLVQTSPQPAKAAPAAGRKAEYRKITADEAQAIMQKPAPYTLVDVRTEGEFADGHIAGAILLPDFDIALKAPSVLPDKDATILIYCRSGRRSANAAHELIKMGYTNVHDMGGLNAWPYAAVTE